MTGVELIGVLALVWLITREVISYLTRAPRAEDLIKQQQDYEAEVARVTKEIEDAKIAYRNSRTDSPPK